MRRLACCRPIGTTISVDLDEPEKIKTYNGLESIMLNNANYDDESSTSRGDGCVTDSLDEVDSCSSSSKGASGSFSSQCLVNKYDQHGLDDWEEEVVSKRTKDMSVKEEERISIQVLDVNTMKEKFAKLLLGDDVTGGSKGLTTALSLSNAITNLAASIFGELWKLEPLSEERKSRWQKEMSWFLSPTNYMVELVPSKQDDANGHSLEIMTAKVRSDIHLNLPALQKLDSMLIETLDSMINTEFCYVEKGSRAEGRTKIERRWWLPSPQVPMGGLSVCGRKKLLYHVKVVDQVFKAAKLINTNVLLDMPVPPIVKDALPKSGKASLVEDVYRVLSSDQNSTEEMLASLDLKNEHIILQTMNQLEASVLAWKQKIFEKVHAKSPLRSPWSQGDKTELLLERAESLLQALKTEYPHLPQTFLDVTKVQYNKDVGQAILEAYSRVTASLAFSILSRIRDILQVDELSNPNSPAMTYCPAVFETPNSSKHFRHSLIEQMNNADGQDIKGFKAKKALGVEFVDCEIPTRSMSMISNKAKTQVWCNSLARTNST